MKGISKRKTAVSVTAIAASVCLACGVGLMAQGGMYAVSAAEKEYTTAINTGFGEQFYNTTTKLGEWKQTVAESADEIDELVGTVEAEGTLAGKAYLDGTFGGLLNGDDFTIEYDAEIANGQVGFNFRAAKSTDYNPYQGFGGVLVRLDAGLCYVLSNGAVKSQLQYGSSVAVGDSVHVTVAVTGTSMDLLVKKETTELVTANNVEICAKDTNANANGAQNAIRAGFYLEGSEGHSSTFSNVVIKSGSATYKAFPFEGQPAYDGSAYEELGEATGKINPNFSVMCGTMAEGENGSFVQAKTLHPQFTTATASGTFGGVYGENFTVEFDATTALQNEDIAGDEGSGFYFRCDSGADCFMGNTIRLQRGGVHVFVYDHNQPNVEKHKIGYVFEYAPVPGSIVHIKMVVKGNNATFSFADENGKALRFLVDGRGEYVTEHTFNGLKPQNEGYDGEADYAGLFTSKTRGKFKNFVMTNEEGKRFEAWPYAAGKEDLSDEFELVTKNSADRIVKIDADNPDLDKADKDLVGSFDYIIYADYNGAGHALQVNRKSGDMAGYVTEILYQLPPYTSFTVYPEAGEVDAGRHGITVKVADEEGYVYANFKWALRIVPTQLTIEGVTAVEREYDGTRVVELTGGRLVGVPEGVEIGFTLGEGQLTSAAAGQNKEVETDIRLTGDAAVNFSLVQPVVTVNILKATTAAPETPVVEVNGTTVTVKATDEDDYLEFKLDDGEWQDSRVFENVAKGKHTVSVRYKDDINTAASEAAVVEVTVGSAKKGCNGSVGAISAGALGALAIAAVGVALKKKKEGKN